MVVCQCWKGPLKKQGCTRVSFYLKDAPADETGSAAKTCEPLASTLAQPNRKQLEVCACELQGSALEISTSAQT